MRLVQLCFFLSFKKTSYYYLLHVFFEAHPDTVSYNICRYVTLVLSDGGHVLPGGGQAVDPSAVDPPFGLHVVLKGAVYSGGQTGNVLRLKHQL